MQHKAQLMKYLKISLFSVIGFFVSLVLHNVIYALGIVLAGEDFWVRTGLTDEPIFFLVAVIICPIAFLVGIVGSLYWGVKNIQQRAKSKSTH